MNIHLIYMYNTPLLDVQYLKLLCFPKILIEQTDKKKKKNIILLVHLGYCFIKNLAGKRREIKP